LTKLQTKLTWLHLCVDKILRGGNLQRNHLCKFR